MYARAIFLRKFDMTSDRTRPMNRMAAFIKMVKKTTNPTSLYHSFVKSEYSPRRPNICLIKGKYLPTREKFAFRSVYITATFRNLTTNIIFVFIAFFALCIRTRSTMTSSGATNSTERLSRVIKNDVPNQL